MLKSSKFEWDSHSDQPYIIKDKVYKKAMRKKHLNDWFKILWTNMIIFPLGILLSRFFKGEDKNPLRVVAPIIVNGFKLKLMVFA